LAGFSRTPNQTSGYFIPTGTSSTTITDATNAAQAPVGDSIVIRTAPSVIDKRKVTGNSSGVLTVATLTFNPSSVGGKGWFVYGNLPDSATEWRDTAGNIQVYSVGSPSGSYTVPAVDTCLLSEGTNQTFDHIRFEGGNNSAIILAFQAVANIIFSNDSIDYSYDGIQMRSDGAITVTNTWFSHLADAGVLKFNANNYNNTFTNDSLFDIGMIPGMGGSGNAASYYTGIVAGDSGSVIKFCYEDSIGYHGVMNFGSGFVVDSSWINKFCQTLIDGGGIYTWINSNPSYARGRQIIGNTCSNGGTVLAASGTTFGISDQAFGVYIDSHAESVTVSGNTSYNNSSGGFFTHGANNTFLNNTSYLSGYSDFDAAEISGEVITGLIIKHNIFTSVTSSIPAIRFSTIGSDITTMATSDSNQLAGATGSTLPFWTFSIGDAGTFRTQASWNTTTGQDAHSNFQTGNLTFKYNPTASAVIVPLQGTYKDVFNNGYSGSTVLQPFTSLPLFILSCSCIPLIPGARTITH
jgi:hypothetical protein